MSEWIRVATLSELPPGGIKLAATEIGTVAIFNIGGGLLAIEDRCSHDGGELASGQCVGDCIVCPRHGARFSLRTGEALTPPAYESIATFPLRIDGEAVLIDIG